MRAEQGLPFWQQLRSPGYLCSYGHRPAPAGSKDIQHARSRAASVSLPCDIILFRSKGALARVDGAPCPARARTSPSRTSSAWCVRPTPSAAATKKSALMALNSAPSAPRIASRSAQVAAPSARSICSVTCACRRRSPCSAARAGAACASRRRSAALRGRTKHRPGLPVPGPRIAHRSLVCARLAAGHAVIPRHANSAALQARALHARQARDSRRAARLADAGEFGMGRWGFGGRAARLADAGDLADRQRVHEGGHRVRVGRQHELAVRLVDVRRDLGQQAVGRDAAAARHAHLLAHAPPQLLRHLAACAPQAACLSERGPDSAPNTRRSSKTRCHTARYRNRLRVITVRPVFDAQRCYGPTSGVGLPLRQCLCRSAA